MAEAKTKKVVKLFVILAIIWLPVLFMAGWTFAFLQPNYLMWFCGGAIWIWGWVMLFYHFDFIDKQH